MVCIDLIQALESTIIGANRVLIVFFRPQETAETDERLHICEPLFRHHLQQGLGLIQSIGIVQVFRHFEASKPAVWRVRRNGLEYFDRFIMPAATVEDIPHQNLGDRKIWPEVCRDPGI